jgi:P-type Ca2+ transporter type 2C
MKYAYTGLTDAEVQESRSKFGSNALSPHKGESFWSKLRDNFKDPIIIILCVALVIIVLLSLFDHTEWYDALAIFAAVILATFVSTYSEFKNEASFQKLQEEASRIFSNVFRNGHLTRVLISDIVVGDHVLLQSGDKIPADGRIIYGEVKVNQASLTGESESVTKNAAPEIVTEYQTDLSSSFQVFRGSVVEDGEAVLEVDSVGDLSIYGKLARELSESAERPSPLQTKLANLAKLISRFGYAAATTIALVFIFKNTVVDHNFDPEKIIQYITGWDVFLKDTMDTLILAIIILVAAVPEGLPMMIAIVLSLNMQKLLREKVLVRKLLGIETAGSLNILFTDKTGTITKGQFEPKLFLSGSRRTYNGYSQIPNPLRELLSVSILENTASVISPDGQVEGGNISGRALIAFIDKKDIVNRANLSVQLEKSILFNSARKFSASMVKSPFNFPGTSKNRLTLINGAPELIIERCQNYIDETGKPLPLGKEEYTTILDRMSNDGMRLIAIAISGEPLEQEDAPPANCTLVGVVAIRDEIRAESKKAIEETLAAGIQIVMITGDRKGTAIAIATEVGLIKSHKDLVLTSEELNRMSDDEVKIVLPRLRVIARALPSDKSRLVRITKKIGKVAGMTGDGVNDSAALKQSDVGFAMGSGSEVSKEASDIVILDDNFNSLANAVRYGRTIFKSIRKFIVFQLTINIAAVSIVFLGPLVGVPMPLTIIQLLWINIIMDTLGALAFGGEPALRRFMKEPPVSRDENIITYDMRTSILTGGIFLTVLSLSFLTFDPFREFFVRNGVPDERIFLTAYFNLFVFTVAINSFNARTEKINLLEEIRKNRGFLRIIGLILIVQVIFTYVGGTILRASPLLPKEWLLIVLLSLLIIPVDIIRKLILRRWKSTELPAIVPVTG